jgi:hypothetical protein
MVSVTLKNLRGNSGLLGELLKVVGFQVLWNLFEALRKGSSLPKHAGIVMEC